MKTTIISLLCLWVITSQAFGQTTDDRRYIRILVYGVGSSSQSQEIDTYFRSQPGVITSRMDKQTGKYLGIYSVSSGLTDESFTQGIAALGFETGCVVSGIHGNGERVKALTAENCQNGTIPAKR